MQRDRVRISALLDLYGAALSERRREALQLYYDDDLSLAEIAENTGITRQGVRDAIVKGENELAAWEEKLGFYSKSASIRSVAEDIAAEAEREGSTVISELSSRLLSEI